MSQTPSTERISEIDKVTGEAWSSDRCLVRLALTYWANYIETGDLEVSKDEAVKKASPFIGLDSQQAATVRRLRIMATLVEP